MNEPRLLTKFLLHFLLCQLFSSCQSRSGFGLADSETNHAVFVTRNDGSVIKIDRISSDKLLAKTSSDATTYFSSLEVTFIDSASLKEDQQTKVEWNTYFQYHMEKNWRVMDQGDSLSPVFFQPLTKKKPFEDAGILVFEIDNGHHADTIVYNDPYNSKTQIFILKN